jgi:hypothetical protein
MGKELDAVTIATPTPARAARAAGDPARHSRVRRKTSGAHDRRSEANSRRRRNVAAWSRRWANQGQSSEGKPSFVRIRLGRSDRPSEGSLCWTDRANGCLRHRGPPARRCRKKFDWDRWNRPAPFRDYHEGLHPHDWHSWRDFGNGSIGQHGLPHHQSRLPRAENSENPHRYELGGG